MYPIIPSPSIAGFGPNFAWHSGPLFATKNPRTLKEIPVGIALLKIPSDEQSLSI